MARLENIAGRWMIDNWHGNLRTWLSMAIKHLNMRPQQIVNEFPYIGRQHERIRSALAERGSSQTVHQDALLPLEREHYPDGANDMGIGSVTAEDLYEIERVLSMQERIEEKGRRSKGRSQIQLSKKIKSKSTGKVYNRPETLSQGAEIIVNEHFNGDQSRFAEAVVIAGKTWPNLVDELNVEKFSDQYTQDRKQAEFMVSRK